MSSAISAVARLDLHCHTLHSGDCFVPLEQVVQVAAARGVTHLAITDHDSCECGRRNGAGSWPIELIFGEEITLADGRHLIALDIQQELNSRTLADSLREIHRLGGFIVVPHPFKKGSGLFAGHDQQEMRKTRELVEEFADAIEVCNSKLPDRDNRRAFELARQLGKAITAGADAHFGHDVGDAVLEVLGDTTATGWRELVRRGSGARVLMNRFARQKLFDEHLTDTRINNLLPRVRWIVPKRVRAMVKRALHRSVYQPRTRHRDFALEELHF